MPSIQTRMGFFFGQKQNQIFRKMFMLLFSIKALDIKLEGEELIRILGEFL